MPDRIFVDPDRGDKWRVSKAIHIDGRLCLAFKSEAVWMWAEQELTSEIDAISDAQLHEMWRSRREIRYKKERWWVWWEERPDLQTWTWFESESGKKGVVKAQIMFPFHTGPELADVLSEAERSR